jgi:hypothetical protein
MQEVVQVQGRQVSPNFYLKKQDGADDGSGFLKFIDFDEDESENDQCSTLIGYDFYGFIQALRFNSQNISTRQNSKIGYFDEVVLRALSTMYDREFVAKGHLGSSLGTVSGINPVLVFSAAILSKSYNVVRNLEILATSSEATIVIEDDNAGEGQVLQCFVINNSAVAVNLILDSTDGILYPDSLPLVRDSNELTIPANSRHLICFIRSDSNWLVAHTKYVL